MTTGTALSPDALDLLTSMQNKAVERFELELSDLRTAMKAITTSCEDSLTRLRDAKWISGDDALRMMADSRKAAESERSRAEHLVADLEAANHQIDEIRAACRNEIEAAKHEVDEVRAACRAEVEAAKGEVDEVRTRCEVEIAIAREAAHRSRDERAAAFIRELTASRERATSAMEAEAKLREQLAAMEARNQEIVDTQMLRLVELKRELERASTEANRAREAAEKANREAAAKLAPRAVSEPAAAAAPRAVAEQPAAAAPQPRPVEAKRNHLAPEFDAIEAVLAGSPPAVAWERTA